MSTATTPAPSAARDLHAREPDAADAVDRQPLAGAQSGLMLERVPRGHEPAPERGRGLERDLLGKRHAVEVGVDHPHELARSRRRGSCPRNSSASHRLVRPLRQYAHTPHASWNGTATRSPTLTRVTSSPTASTAPENSCPIVIGSGGARPTHDQSPIQVCQSVRQMPSYSTAHHGLARARVGRRDVLDNQRLRDLDQPCSLQCRSLGLGLSSPYCIRTGFETEVGCRAVTRRMAQRASLTQLHVGTFRWS